MGGGKSTFSLGFLGVIPRKTFRGTRFQDGNLAIYSGSILCCSAVNGTSACVLLFLKCQGMLSLSTVGQQINENKKLKRKKVPLGRIYELQHKNRELLQLSCLQPSFIPSITFWRIASLAYGCALKCTMEGNEHMLEDGH